LRNRMGRPDFNRCQRKPSAVFTLCHLNVAPTSELLSE
jgi:hypothetical protein